MTYIPKSSPMLQALQKQMAELIQKREEAAKNYIPSSVKCDTKSDIRIKPTAEDILLMEEYSRGVYQGD